MRTIGVVSLFASSALACAGPKGSHFDGVGEAISSAPAPEPPATPKGSTGCPEGVIAIDYWQGEYPGPVVQVREAFTAPGFADVCDPAPTIDCHIPDGLYHPWAGKGGEFKTVRSVDAFVATSAFKLSNGEITREIGAGDTVLVTGYLGEGFCIFQVADTRIEAECPGVGDAPLVEKPGGPAISRQLFKSACLAVTPGGARTGWAWIEVDDAFMARPQVTDGVILGYGEVGPAD